MESKKLFAGERFLLTDDTGFWRIVSGKVEVYATTQTGADISFHQCYLIDRAPGEAVFPAMDEFGEIRMQVYVLEDAELEFIPWQQVEMAELRLLMEDWFAALIKINWLRLMADKGDDVLQRWRRSKLFDQADSHEKLMTSFREHEEILSMLLGVRFGASDKRLARHIRRREMAKVVLVENGIRSLLGEEQLFSGQSEVERGSKLTMDAAFAVRQVAGALRMPTEAINLEAESARGLDEVAILRRLMQKGNMQMRLVTLSEDWWKRDTGVMLGFYTPPGSQSKEIAALLPSDAEHYRLFSAARPQGIAVTEGNLKYIAKDAFQCYAGFPARALKLWDLIKFMFRQCWIADYRTILVCSLFAGLIPLATPIITETIFQDIIPILDRQGLATVTQALIVHRAFHCCHAHFHPH